MIKKIIIITCIFLGVCLCTHVWAQDTGNIPVPAFSNAEVEAEVAYVSETDLYTYSYTISNPATNAGEIWKFEIDISRPKYSATLSSNGLTISRGHKTQTFEEVLSKRNNPEPMVPVGISIPTGWSGSLANRGFASFYSKNESPNILPGETKDGFQLISRGLPGIRSIEIQPWWMMVRDESATEESTAVGIATTRSLKFTTKTIGPTAPPRDLVPATFLDMINGYIDECVTLGWLLDSSLVSALKAKLDSIPPFIEDDDPSSAKVVLGEIMELINQATSSQLTSEARGLLFYNIQHLKDALPDTYIPPVFTFTITPEKATLPIGAYHQVTVTSKIDGEPIGRGIVSVHVVSGPNEGLELEGRGWTNSSTGQRGFGYKSIKVGTDTLVVKLTEPLPSSLPSPRGVMLALNDVNQIMSDIVGPGLGITLASNDYAEAYEATTDAYAEVTWAGGPDLTVPLFAPPIIRTEGGNTIYITEITENDEDLATIAAGSSTTRYYISEDDIIDPETDIVLGERGIPALEVGESSESIELQFQIPDYFPAGTYYCGGCADADNIVAELDEDNNCDNNELTIVAVMERCGDLNGDGKVDAADANILRSRFRACTGNDNYIEEADYDKDGCITFNDYREWYKCYLAFINQ